MWFNELTQRLGFAPRVDLSRRADPAELPELMDSPQSYEDLRVCLRDLAQCNRVTRGYQPTLAFLDRVLDRDLALRGAHAAPMEVLDVGFGYGDVLREVRRWARRRGVAVRLTGIDLQPWSARVAAEADRRARVPAGEIRWMAGNAFQYAGPQPDLVLSSLVMHHLRDPEIMAFLRWMERSARLGWWISDLERAEQPYRWFGVLARAMRWHRFERHDGPVSFRRAFRMEDWERLLREAGVSEARLVRSRPARLCVERVRQ